MHISYGCMKIILNITRLSLTRRWATDDFLCVFGIPWNFWCSSAFCVLFAFSLLFACWCCLLSHTECGLFDVFVRSFARQRKPRRALHSYVLCLCAVSSLYVCVTHVCRTQTRSQCDVYWTLSDVLHRRPYWRKWSDFLFAWNWLTLSFIRFFFCLNLTDCRTCWTNFFPCFGWFEHSFDLKGFIWDSFDHRLILKRLCTKIAFYWTSHCGIHSPHLRKIWYFFNKTRNFFLFNLFKIISIQRFKFLK